MTTAASPRSPASGGGAAGRDSTGLVFVAQMYGLQIDHLAALLALSHRQASALAARWVRKGMARTEVLSAGPPWVWLTRAGLQACGFRYAEARPGLSQLAHIRAVTAVRLALEAAPLYREGGAYWRSERDLRARMPGGRGSRDHLPDAEVHWPEFPASGAAPPWAGECWAIEAELTPKTVARTVDIMRELLARTGDYGAAAAQASVAGTAPRHARAIYLCSPAARRTVERAKIAALGSLADGRIEIRALPVDAYLQSRA